MATKDHPDRARVLAELHARPFTPLRTGTRLVHFAFRTTGLEAEHDRNEIVRLAVHEGRDPHALNERYLLLDTRQLRWERHGEFITYTFPIPPNVEAKWPNGLRAPGELLVAIDLRLTQETVLPPGLVQASIVGGDAHLVSDFLPNEAGFVEILVASHGMSDETAGATVQRVLELETYRCFALLGLPVAERAATAIAGIEGELPVVMEKMDAAETLEDNRELLHRLTALTFNLERSSAETHFRFGASRSYAELVRLRLDALAETATPGQAGLTAFFSRRFDPAMRFCATLSHREANLARKLTRAAQLLRTRVEIAMQSQNGELLAAMSNRLRLQLRLQRTVEGLSVAAVAYYVTSLLHYVLMGAGKYWPFLEKPIAMAVAVPITIVLIAVLLVRVRQQHSEDNLVASPSSPTSSQEPEISHRLRVSDLR